MSPRNSQNSFKVGEHVLCFEPDSSKAKVLYNAKVVDVENMTDKKGKQKPMYMIHFLGWNSSWDRLVPESFILKDTPEHRLLRNQLSKICQQIKGNRKRVDKIDGLLEKFFQGASRLVFEDNKLDIIQNKENTDDDAKDIDDDKTCSDLSTEMNMEDDASVCSLKSDISQNSKRSSDHEEDRNYEVVLLEVSDVIKEVLNLDFQNIKKKNQLVKIPSEMNVIRILELAVRSYARSLTKDAHSRARPNLRNQYPSNNWSKSIDLCKETADGLRVMFDFTLPLILLYDEEREQYARLFQNVKTESCYMDASNKETITLKTEKKQNVTVNVNKERRVTRKSSIGSQVNYYIPVKKRKNRSQHEECLLPAQDTSKAPLHIDAANDDISCTTFKEPILDELKSDVDRVAKSKSNYEPFASTVQLNNLKESLSLQHNDEDEGTVVAKDASDSWSLLPSDASLNLPVFPSSVYGAQHLARLFVKLPELLAEMGISKVYLPHLRHHLNNFIEFLSDHPELFSQTVYINNSYKIN